MCHHNLDAGGDTYVQIRPQHQGIGSCTTANSTTIYLVQLRKHPEPKQQAIRLASRHESCRFSIDSRNDPGYRYRGHRRDVVLAGTWLNLSLEMSILSWPRSCVCLPTVIESYAWRRIVDVLERSHFGYMYSLCTSRGTIILPGASFRRVCRIAARIY